MSSFLRETPTALIKILEKPAQRLRRERFALFKALTSLLPRPLNILDLGGTQKFWDSMNFTEDVDVKFTLVNLDETQAKVTHPNFRGVVGDARRLLNFNNKEFDIVFSNSLIEHVGNYEQQFQMAEEVRRLGKRYFIQTPNYFFPIEPHFQFPFFQFLPLNLKVFLLCNFSLGWFKKAANKREAVEAANSIRLLTKRDLRNLFPEATIYEEKLFGLTKSFIAYSGWDKH